VQRNCAGEVPEAGVWAAEDEALLASAHGLLAEVRASIDAQAPHAALSQIWRIVAEANGYVDRQAPWALRKSDPARMGTVLYVLAEVIRHLGIVMQPFTPSAAERLLDQLVVPADARSFADLGPAGALVPGTALPRPTGIFPRFVESEGEPAEARAP
jgi:methionyl-tRNA synthetase